MSSERDRPDDPRLPFEPGKKRKKNAKTQPTPASSNTSPKSKSVKAEAIPHVTPQKSKSAKAEAIPQVVSQRMGRRMAIFSGVPTTLGIATFFVSYWIVSQGIFKLPNVAVILVSMGFFGLGVIGLSYGVISASWDEETPGSKLGWQEFTTNCGRLISAWRSARQKD